MSFVATTAEMTPPPNHWRCRILGTSSSHLVPFTKKEIPCFSGFTTKTFESLLSLLFDESYYNHVVQSFSSDANSPSVLWQIRGRHLALRIKDRASYPTDEQTDPTNSTCISVEDANKYLVERHIFDNDAKSTGNELYLFDVVIPISTPVYHMMQKAQILDMLCNNIGYSSSAAAYLQVETPWESERDRFLDDSYQTIIHAIPRNGYVTLRLNTQDTTIKHVWVVFKVLGGEITSIERFIIKKGGIYETFKTIPSVLKR